ncbi:MAG: HAD hydrolase family protein [Pirellulaceae bacterium]
MQKNKLEDRCRPIELLLTDVDGVLTDGGVSFSNEGIESKQFNIRDGLGIKLWRKAGYRCGLITGRNSQVVRLRSVELGIEIVRQGVAVKLPVVEEVMRQLKLSPEQVAYIGDDLPDLPVIKAVGLGVAVGDAAGEVQEGADYVTTAAGGRGAVRETIELILKAKKTWHDVIQEYQ